MLNLFNLKEVIMAKVNCEKKLESGGEGWFTRGAEEAKKTREQLQKEYVGQNTFWISGKKGESKTAKVIFLDELPFNIYVHNIWIRGNKKRYTCSMRGCPLCMADLKRSFVSVYRLIDLRTFKGDKGVSPPKQKFYEVGSILQPVVEKLMKRGSLYHKIVEIERTGVAKQTNYLFDPVGEVDPKLLAKLKSMGLWVPLIDPIEVYAPKDQNFLKEVAATYGGGVGGNGWEEEQDSTKDSEEVVDYLDEEDEDEE